MTAYIFMRSEGSCCWFSYLKVLLGAVGVGVFLWLLIVGSVESGGRPVAKTIGRAEAESVVGGRHVKQAKVLPNNNHPELDPNFMSKIKVPKGPDPIHNRRIGVKGGPPGRA